MTNEGFTSYSEKYRPEIKEILVGKHRVLHGAVEDCRYLTSLQGVADIIVTDTPAVDEQWSLDRYESWLREQVLPAIDAFTKKDAVMILIPHNRKGAGWLKSVSTASCVQHSPRGWQCFRHWIWHRQESPYHRSTYAFVDVYGFRRGDRPSNLTSPFRHLDIIQSKAPPTSGTIGGFSIDLIVGLLSLFSRPTDVILDPFAGTGAVAIAAQRLGLSSISIELGLERFESIVQSLRQEVSRDVENPTT